MSSDEDMQSIPARHGTATFVPKGSTIKIVNSSGTQVIDTWVFALPDPPKSLKAGSAEAQEDKKAEDDKAAADKKDEVKKAEAKKSETPAKEEKKSAESPNTKKGRKSKDDMGLPTQEEAEAATAKGVQEGEKQEGTPQKATWSSYLPSLRGSGKKQQPAKEDTAPPAPEEEKKTGATDKAQQKANSRTWGSYLSAGQGFTSYLPSKGAISAFASSHQRDTSKTYAEQLADFSRTPVGAASFSALTGSGVSSSLYAGYSAWSSGNQEGHPMEFLSLPHSRASTCHMIPQVDDVLVSNLRQPMVTFVEDTSKGRHDTLMAACDPARYKELGVENWEEHGSCAENLVLALKELNERAGLKGAKGIGADVTINSVPAPLNLFMNIPWQGEKGDLKFSAPDCKEGDYVRMRAERDVVVIMSACPQDMTEVNGEDKLPQDGHFIVETPEEDSDDEVDIKKKLAKASQPPKKPRGKPRKLGSSTAASSKRPSVQGSASGEEKKPAKIAEEKKPARLADTKETKPAEAKKEFKPAEEKKETKPTEEKKTNGAPSAPAASEPAAAPAAKPRGKPKKLVDSTTGEKKKPKKLEKRTPAAASNGDQAVS